MSSDDTTRPATGTNEHLETIRLYLPSIARHIPDDCPADQLKIKGIEARLNALEAEIEGMEKTAGVSSPENDPSRCRSCNGLRVADEGGSCMVCGGTGREHPATGSEHLDAIRAAVRILNTPNTYHPCGVVIEHAEALAERAGDAEQQLRWMTEDRDRAVAERDALASQVEKERYWREQAEWYADEMYKHHRDPINIQGAAEHYAEARMDGWGADLPEGGDQ